MKKFVIVSILTIIIYLSLSLGNSVTGDIQINLDFIDGIRNLSRYPGQIEIIYKGSSENEIEIINIKMLYDNSIIWQKPISKTLIGVGEDHLQFKSILQTYAELQNIENPTQSQINMAKKAYENAMTLYPKVSKGMHNEIVTIDPNLIFGSEFLIGNRKTITFIIEFANNGRKYEVTKDLTIEVLHPIPTPNISFVKTPSDIKLAPAPAEKGWYYGDLHVHSNYTNCDWIGSSNFSVLDRKGQAITGVGFSWLSITDHSYCFGRDLTSAQNKWDNMKRECLDNTDSSFIILPSEELSVSDSIPDLEYLCEADSCVGNAAHLGAHNLNEIIPNLWGPCLNPIGVIHFTGRCPASPTAEEGINAVFGQSNFSIINHPKDNFWDWENMDVEGFTGIEVWNGLWNKHKFPNLDIIFDDNWDSNALKWWTSLLLQGNHVFAYGGSDAEPESISSNGVFNAVYVTCSKNDESHNVVNVTPGPGDNCFTGENLTAALKAGHVYVSNGPALVLHGETSQGSGMMGDTLKATNDLEPNAIVKLNIVYNLDKPGVIILHKGVIGERDEDPKDDPKQKWPLIFERLESGYISIGDRPTKDIYYRAEFISQDYTQRAFTNPIWIIPSVRLFVEKIGPSVGNPGNVITYTINLRNDGKEIARDIAIIDTIPPAMSYVSSTIEPSFIDEIQREIYWNFDEFGSGQLKSIDVTFKLSDVVLHGIEICNSVSLFSGDPQIVVSDSHCLMVSAEGVKIYVAKGMWWGLREWVNYRWTRDPIVAVISLFNYGSITAQDVTITDTIPFYEYVSFSPTNDDFIWSFEEYNPLTKILTKYSKETGTFTWIIKELPPGIVKNFGFRLWLKHKRLTNDTELCNEVEVEAESKVQESNTVCINTMNNPDLYDPPSFKKTVSSSQAYKGDVLQFTLEINNLGDGSAINVTWSDHQPMYIDYVPGTIRFELYDLNEILKSSGNASDPLIIHNEDSSTTLIFGNIVPEIGAGETLKIYYESKISENTPVGIKLMNEARVESYSDVENNIYMDGASASASVTIVEKNFVSTVKNAFSLEPLAYNSIHNCCIPNRQKAYELLSETKKKSFSTYEIERNLREADSLVETAKEFYYGGNYIAANNYAQKACGMYKEVIEILKKMLRL